MRDAAQAKAALQAMADAAKAESAASVAGSTKAAQARQQEINALSQQATALNQLATSAKNTNVQLLYGGRNDMQQHLSDQAQTLNYTNLLNRAQWLGFSSVQQAMSYRQQMYNQKLLENRAEFAGYQTADQFLGYMQRRTTAASTEAAAIRARALAIQDETTALLTYDNALQGTHSTLGQLGEGGSTVSALNTALNNLPDEEVTKISIDDGGALAAIETYKAALHSIPGTESTQMAGVLRSNQDVPKVSTQKVPVRLQYEPGSADLSNEAVMGMLSRQMDALNETVRPKIEVDGAEKAEKTIGAVADAMSAARKALHLDVSCEFCGAGYSQPCQTAAGNHIMPPQVHAPRLAASEAADAAGQTEAMKDETAAAAALAAELSKLDGTKAVTTAEFSDGDAAGQVVKYTWWVDHIPDRVGTVAEFDYSLADAELQGFIQKLVEYSRWKLSIAAELDDEPAIAEAMALQARLKSILAGETETITEQVVQTSIGSGGGGPGAAEALAEEMDRLRDAEGAAGDQARLTADDFLQMAGAADSGAKAAAYMRAAAVASQLAESGLSDELRSSTDDLLRQAAAAETGTKAAVLARLASLALADAEQRAAAAARKAAAAEQDAAREAAAAAAAAAFAAARTGPQQLAITAGPEQLALPPGTGEAAEALTDDMNKLRDAEAGAGEQAGITAEDFLRMAAGTTNGAKAYAYVQAAAIAAKLAMADVDDETRASTEDWLRLVAGANSGAQAYAYARAAAAAMGQAEEAVAAGAQKATGAINDVSRAIPPMVDGLLASYSGWYGLTSELNLFGGILGTVPAWHALLDFLIEFAAVFIPALATMAAGLIAFGAAGYKAFEQVAERVLAVHTAVTATDQELTPFTGHMQQLENSLRPQVWELYGEAILATKNNTGIFGQLATETADKVDQLGARLVIAMTNGGNGLKSFFALGSADLTKLGEFFDNLGKAFLEFLKVSETTQISQIFLSFFVVLSQLLVLVSKLPTPILVTVVALHGLYLWGGLAATVIMKLLDPLRSLALAMGAVKAESVEGGLVGLTEDSSAWARLKAGLADINAGFSALVTRLKSVGPAAKAAAADAAAAGEETVAAGAGSGVVSITGEEAGAAGAVALERDITGVAAAEKEAAGATGLFSGALGSLGSTIAKLGIFAIAAAFVYLGVKVAQAKDSTQQWINQVNSSLGSASLFTVVGKTMDDLAQSTKQLNDYQGNNAQAAHEMAGAQTQLSTQLQQELVHTGQIASAYGVSMPMALSLLNAAGVKTSALFTTQNGVWSEAQQQVAALVQGYKAMGQGMSEIQRDVSVQLVMESSQLKSMQSLNTAWDDFQQVVAAPYSDVIKLAQGFQQFATDAKAAGASMSGLSPASLTLQSDFQSSYGDVETLFDAMRNSEAVTGSGGFTSFVKDAVAALIPLAQGNKAATAEVSQLAQEAGGPATTSLTSLAKWAGNVHDPLTKMYEAAQKATGKTADLDTDAARLSTTLQNDLAPALANSAFAALGGQQALNKFSGDLLKLGPNSKTTIDAGKQVAQMFLSIDKNSTSAKAQFVGWAESMGLTKDQANKLWGEVSKGEKPMATMRDGLAKGSTNADKLGKSLGKEGLLGQMRDLTAQGFDQMGSFFTKTLPGDWSAAYQTFERNFGSPIAHWFDDSLPHFFTHTLPNTWDTVYQNFFRGFASPVAHWFDTSLPNFFTKTIPADAKAMGSVLEGDGKSFGSGFMREFGSPISSFFTKTVGGYFSQMGSSWLTNVKGMVKNWKSNVVSTMEEWALQLVPGWMTGTGTDWKKTSSGMWKDFNSIVVGPSNTFFTKTLPGWFDSVGRWWGSLWSGNMKAFSSQVIQPSQSFFTKTVPGWFNDVGRWWTALWSANWKDFQTQVINGTSNFFTKTVPGWFDDVTRWWDSLWSGNMKSFQSEIINGFSAFFTKTLPGWFNDVGRWWTSLWSGNMTSFDKTILQPMEKWFSSSLPAAIKAGFKEALDWVITNVINQTIKFINTDILSHLPGGLKISYVSPVASGGAIRMASGSVPGTGDEDGTHIIAMGGEYMLRKPARMALEQAYGSNFLNRLNQADSWLGTGSRGNPASQRATASNGRYAPGGGIGGALGSIEGFFSGVGNALTDSAKDLSRYVSGGVGALKSLAGKGAEAIFNAVWDTTIKPMFGVVPGSTIPGAVLQGGANELKQGIDNFLTQQDTTAKTTEAAGANLTGTSHAVSSYRAVVDSVLKQLGLPTSDDAVVLAQMETESGGNPDVVNKTDSNWAAGTPSVGLMQVIGPTFAEYAGPYRNTGPFEYGVSVNPEANIYAGIHYAESAYGSGWVNVLGHGHGYASGGAIGGDGASLTGMASGLTVPPAGMDNAQSWEFYSGELVKAAADQNISFWDLNARHLPAAATKDQWASWYADLGILQTNQKNIYEGGSSVYQKIAGGLSDPASISPSWWAQLRSLSQRQLRFLRDQPTPPSSYWSQEKNVPWPSGYKTSKGKTPGSIPPSAWAAWKFENGPWNTAVQDALGLYNISGSAENAWKGVYDLSTGAGTAPPASGTPGVVVTPTGGPTYSVDLGSLITGGPGTPVIPTGYSASGTGSGFAMGGPVGGDGASLGSVAGMFAMGGPTLATAPVASPAFASRMAAGGVAADESMTPRTMGANAAGGGDRVGVKVDSLHIHNPVPEKPSESITRSSNRLAFLAGRGSV